MKSISKFLLLAAFVAIAPSVSFSQEDGETDLAKATTTKLEAKSLADYDKVVELLESALKKGLDEDSTESANELLQATLLDYSKRLTAPIFTPPQDARWQFLRDQALKKLEKLEKMDNKWSETYYLIARLNALPRGNRTKANEAISKAIKFAEDDQIALSRALTLRGALSRDEKEKISDLNQAIKLNPNNVDALRQRATYLFTKDQKKAVQDFEKLLKLTDGNPLAYQQLLEALTVSGESERAMEVANEAIEKFPKAPAPYTARARLYLIKSSEAEAKEAEAAKDDDSPKAPKPETTDEPKKESDKFLDLAMKDLDKSIELNNKDVLPLMLRAELLMNMDKSAEAKKDVDQMLRVRPGLIRGVYLRAMIAADQAKFGDAARDLELLVDSVPENPVYKLQLAAMYSADERPRKAIDLYNEVLDLDEENRFAIRGRGDAYLNVGDHAEAKKDYEASLKINYDDDHVLNNYSWLLSTSPKSELRDGKKAVKLALKACELTDYKLPHILSTLAAGYAESGDFEKAKEWAGKAVELAKSIKDDSVEDLQKELDSYKENKPWREKQEST